MRLGTCWLYGGRALQGARQTNLPQTLKRQTSTAISTVADFCAATWLVFTPPLTSVCNPRFWIKWNHQSGIGSDRLGRHQNLFQISIAFGMSKPNIAGSKGIPQMEQNRHFRNRRRSPSSCAFKCWCHFDVRRKNPVGCSVRSAPSRIKHAALSKGAATAAP